MEVLRERWRVHWSPRITAPCMSAKREILTIKHGVIPPASDQHSRLKYTLQAVVH